MSKISLHIENETSKSREYENTKQTETPQISEDDDDFDMKDLEKLKNMEWWGLDYKSSPILSASPFFTSAA